MSNKWINQNKALSSIKFQSDNEQQTKIREQIVKLSKEYFEISNKKEIIPGEDYIQSNSKVLDENDLFNLVNASLDMWLTSGRFASEFETKLAKKFGTLFSIPTVSGSAADLLALSCLFSEYIDNPIEQNSEIITVAASFPTTVAPIYHNNCTPVYLDVDLKTANIEVDQLEIALSDKTRAIMIAHTLGNPFKINEIRNFCNKHNLYLIEDCCDAFGSKYDGQPVGTFGELSTLSFYPAHHITTGEGGAVMTNSRKLKKIVESYRDWGRDCYCQTGMNNTCGKRYSQKLGDLPLGYDHKFVYSHVGYNLKMTDFQAAIGVSQLDKVDKFIEKRIKNFNYMLAKAKDLKLNEHFILPSCYEQSEPSWYGFLLIIRDNNHINRTSLLKFLDENKIITRLLFAGNLTKQPGFMNKNYRKIGDLKNTDKIMNDAFWVGIWPGLEQIHLDYILEKINKFIKDFC